SDADQAHASRRGRRADAEPRRDHERPGTRQGAAQARFEASSEVTAWAVGARGHEAPRAPTASYALFFRSDASASSLLPASTHRLTSDGFSGFCRNVARQSAVLIFPAT